MSAWIYSTNPPHGPWGPNRAVGPELVWIQAAPRRTEECRSRGCVSEV